MTNKNNYLNNINDKLIDWLDDINKHELTSIVDLVEQTKKYLVAIEALPEDKVTQFINNLKYDLVQFFQQSKLEAQHSIYLGLLNEIFWSKLAEITDKTQVEWSELFDDFEHHGNYQQGDIIGFGVLECESCHQLMEYYYQGEVAACAHCQGKSFIRHSLKP